MEHILEYILENMSTTKTQKAPTQHIAISHSMCCSTIDLECLLLCPSLLSRNWGLSRNGLKGPSASFFKNSARMCFGMGGCIGVSSV